MNGEQQPPGGYPPQQGGYPPQQGGYPPQQGGYPPQQGGYPPQQGGYPPQQGGYPPQQGGMMKPSGTPKVMGILMIVFASLGLIGSLYGLAVGPKGELPGEFLKTVRNYGLIVDGLGLVLSVLHLVTGIFSVGYRAKAPLLSNVYGIAALVWGLLRVVLYYVMVAPAFKDLAGSVGEAAGSMAGGMIVVFAVIAAIWPILVLILMNGSKAKEACVK